ncbi:ATP-dependent DNA helicase [Candidatus Woesearchaeota archaeon]|nr:ATP-dependent DNA helicase [Candidatus Woesearchaeota archaeon]
MADASVDKGNGSMRDIFFPYEKVRDIQNRMIELVEQSLKSGSNIVVHAPTGLGKTVATLGPALSYSLKHKKTVFFLTSRHTQHRIAIDTLKEIKERFGEEFFVTDIIGKKWMCLQPGISLLNSHEFREYCRHLREEGTCEFYENTKKGSRPTKEASLAISEIDSRGPMHTDQLISLCRDHKLCPYEVAALIAARSSVIIADYYYVFNPKIRESFFIRSGKTLHDSIIIVDEGHNLPGRMRALMSEKISNFSIRKALYEAKKMQYSETIDLLTSIQNVVNDLSSDLNLSRREKIIDKQDFIDRIAAIKDYDEIVADLSSVAESVREMNKSSSIGAIASFLEKWPGPDDGFVRIISYRELRKEPFVQLSYRCLDPSMLTKEVVENSHSSILMSGTLNPTDMYADLLGFPENTAIISFRSPFPEENKLTVIVNETTTKFDRRNDREFRRIAEIVSEIISLVPGNIVVFFPSYSLRDRIYSLMDISKTVFLEKPEMTKDEKFGMLDNFKSYNDSGAVLLAVSGGNFYEGIDLPGDLLKAVVVVGLPLQQPDLEIKSLIDYYDAKFGKGWDYGYIAPAFSKCLQAAGRCIRSETDRGLVIFLDERFAWKNYYRHFPADTKMTVTRDYRKLISDFFSE